MRECRQRDVGGKARLSETWKHLCSGNTVTVLVWSHWGDVGLVDVSVPAEASSLVSPAILPTQAQLVYLPLQPSYSLFTCNESHDLTTNPTQELWSGTASALLVSHLESWCLRSTQGKVLVALGDASGQLQITQWYWIKQFTICLKGPADTLVCCTAALCCWRENINSLSHCFTWGKKPHCLDIRIRDALLGF